MESNEETTVGLPVAIGLAEVKQYLRHLDDFDSSPPRSLPAP